MSSSYAKADGYYRKDGVRITHDPYTQGMIEKYGKPGATDREGFDPYADSVGAGIYSGRVERNENSAVVWGRQYQNHNTRPGPVYAGGGYTPMSLAISEFHDSKKTEDSGLSKLLTSYPDLANDVATGGAQPLHTCGMSRRNQMATEFLISRGADIEALDTYGYTPLHRMASNNLAVGALALLQAGADPFAAHAAKGESPMQVAMQSRAKDVVRVLQQYEQREATPSTHVSKIVVVDGGPKDKDFQVLEGEYLSSESKVVPTGFAKVCQEQGWDTDSMWKKLNGGEGLRWFKHTENESYIYYNKGDGMWWIDGPDGNGVWKARGPKHAPPSVGWKMLKGDNSKRDFPEPAILVHRGGETECK